MYYNEAIDYTLISVGVLLYSTVDKLLQKCTYAGKTFYYLYNCDTEHEKWKGYLFISLSGLNVVYGLLVPIIYNAFQYSHFRFGAQVGFGLIVGNIANDYKYMGHSAWL